MAIIPDLRADGIVAVPTSLTSAWLYEPGIIESGATYCIESMNAVDYAVAERNVKTVMARTSSRLVRLEAARARRPSTRSSQQKPDLVILTVAPTETAEIISAAAAGGYSGLFIGAIPRVTRRCARRWEASPNDGIPPAGSGPIP